MCEKPIKTNLSELFFLQRSSIDSARKEAVIQIQRLIK